MKEGPDIARIATLIGEPARANMLSALMSGKALTAGELAREAGVSFSTASSHLGKLTEGGLVRVAQQGRHRYFALAGAEVARVLEALMGLAAGKGHLRSRTGPRDAALRQARICYNHLAGEMGIALYDSLVARRLLRKAKDGPELTPAGVEFAESFGVDLAALRRSRVPLCRDCLDWSERRAHLAGSLGRALLTRMQALGWAELSGASRAVKFTRAGAQAFAAAFPQPDTAKGS